jgi:hypothetical protein
MMPTSPSSPLRCRTAGCRDRAGARAPVGGGFPRQPFRVTLGGFTIPPWATFSQAPLRSRMVGFPESGSDLGSHRRLSAQDFSRLK